MAPFVDLGVDASRGDSVGMLRDDDRGAALFHLFDDPVHIKRLVGHKVYSIFVQQNFLMSQGEDYKINHR